MTHPEIDLSRVSFLEQMGTPINAYMPQLAVLGEIFILSALCVLSG